MKRNIIISILSILSAISCNSMLELNPHSAVSPGSVDTKDIEALRSGMYCNVQERPGTESYIMFDLFGGELTTKQSTNSLDLINSLSSGNNALMEDAWQGYYKALMQVNNVFSIAQELPEGNEKNVVLGECHYFRAYIHMCLVTRYGDVPLMRFNTDEKVSRTPAAEVWQFIIEELDMAINLLGTPVSQNYLSSDAAKALKARVALYTGNKAEAARLAESLIADARYGLDSYDKIFRGGHNNEVIFAFSCLTIESSIAISTLFYSYNHPNSGSYVYAPAKEVMNMYADEDNRKEISITTMDNLNFINKYPSGQKGTDPVVISRLGEMYLISAEAQGLANGLPRLNELRAFRGLPAVYPATEAEFIDAILQERRLELLCEGHRWYDLVRLGKAVETLGILEYQTLMPIPEAERKVNGNLTQNPGY
ncbi:MAG: RagB/SusD family nutrient uptake outer membrane protein [Bacteroidales bacterium]|nr:RagB/SusD family nutrient uptake outer membrane protein [Bacteroidales bacterium]